MKIGEKIVEKCGGVPLAITTIAGTLRSKNTRDGWGEVLKSEIWQWQPKSVGGIFPALWLSYCHLSPQLKQCFRYCAIYPKGYTIVKEEVVPMWVAHGYISEEEGREIEDIGREYFDELVRRCLFQDAKWDEYGNINQCGMHDLVYDFARFVTKGEVLVIEGSKNESVSTELHPLHCGILDGGSINKSYINTMGRLKRLRTIASSEESTSCSFIEQLECVRVLKWRSNGRFPDAMHNLVHLRYLSLRGTRIKVSPNSIGRLWNLQYLDLRGTEIKNLSRLGNFLHSLSNLRYLDLSDTDLSLLPNSITELSNLRHLSLESNKISKIPEDVGSLKLLRSLDLSDTNLSLLPSSITELSNLRHLSLGSSKICEIPEAIGSLKLLRSLDLTGTMISKLPLSIANLSYLQELLLNGCVELSMLPKEICQLTGLKKLGNAGTDKLRELPEGIGRLTNLEKLDKFVVVKKDDGKGSSNIEELKQLNNLCGNLEIENLEDVGSKEQAASAHLKLKRCLTIITLSYKTPDQSTNSDAVLQALHPPFCLRKLRINRFPGSKLPAWLGLSSLTGLHELTLYNCIGCTTLPALGNLPELRKLDIFGMPMVTRMTSDLFGSMHGFRKLESLSFEDMKEWEEWEPLNRDADGERIFTFPSLREFRISECPKLLSLPPIWNCENLNSLPEGMHSLQQLHIFRCPLLEPNCVMGGEQWDKISHIPDIRVNDRNVRSILN